MPCPPGFQEHIYGTFWWKIFRDYAGITFYPRCLYHGMLVTPITWHTESPEPIVQCCAMPGWEGYDLNQSFIEHVLETGMPNEYDSPMLADGWDASEIGVFKKFIHIDELDKIEGPPPEGSF